MVQIIKELIKKGNIMTIFKKVNYADTAFSLHQYLVDVGLVQKADLAFQANEFSRWTKEMMAGYIQSLIIGMAPSKFIFCDVAKCLEAAKERNDKKDIRYFKMWLDNGTKYLNIDSNNRNNVIKFFVTGEKDIRIPHGKYDIDGIRVDVDGDNDTYKTLHPAVKNAFDKACITISVYTDVTRAELSKLFQTVNSGKPLNEMELLNSYITKSANVIRNLAIQFAKYFKDSKWFTESQLNRRDIDQFIAKCAFYYCYRLKTTIKLEKLYRDGSDGEQQMMKFKKVFNRFMKTVMTKDAYAIANRNSVFDLFVIYNQLNDEKITVKDNKAFLQSFISSVSELLENDVQYEHAQWKDTKSFRTMVGGTQSTNNVMRNSLIMEIFDYESSTIQKDSARGFSKTDKMILAVKGNWETPEGKEIDMSKLYDGNEYHGGHILPHSEGGATTIENGVLQTKEDNLALGANELVLEDKE